MISGRLAVFGLLCIGASLAQDDDSKSFNNNFFDPDSANEAAPFWWMSKGSPFKRSYESTRVQPIQQRFDFSNNPFLSGRPFAVADSEPAAAENAFARVGSFRGPGYLPPDNQINTVPCNGNGRVCVPRYQCTGGHIDSNQVPSGPRSQECHAENEVCCNIRTPPPPPPPTTRPPPPPPPTTRPTPPPPPPPQRCGPNSGCVSPNQCYNGQINGPPGLAQSAQQCYQPNVCCRIPPPPTPQETRHDEVHTPRPPPPTTARPIITPAPYVPPQTPRPYVPPHVQTPRPIITTTREPFRGDEYIPPHQPDSSNPTNTYLPPEEKGGEDIKSEPIIPFSPSNDQLSVIRPIGPTAPPPLPPIQCPAATNCTEIQFCTSEGTISKTPVVLTRDQETYRVPLSDCRDVVRGFTGKCCRDLDYTDPWPTSILGQYNATILGFDDGSYKPDSNDLGQPSRLRQPPVQRGQGQLSLPIPAATQQTYSKTPYTQGVNRKYSKSPNTPEQNSISQREKLATNKYQPQQSNHHNLQPSKQYLQPYQPTQPQLIHHVQPKPQQEPITHRHVQRQSEPVQIYQPIESVEPVQPIQPEQPAFFQPIVAQEPTVSQPQIPYGQQQYTANPSNGICAVRDTTTIPRGDGIIDASFGEFPWQAMILKESTKTLICGGAIIDGDLVATAAHCVNGIRSTDILIKGGEWKLGSNEEPLPFQLIRVKSITIHPAYQPTTLQSDIALLHLEKNLNFDKHIGPICYDENDVEPNIAEQCVTSGWGKEVLKHHYAGSLPHAMPINPLSSGECQASLAANGFNPSTALCGKPQFDACDVDVGSALVCSSGNGKFLMKGLYSTETGCGASTSQLITFAKMDVPWLRSRGQNGASPVSARYQQEPHYLPPQY